MHTANRLQRWRIILLNYNFKIEFLSSKKLRHADGLSRLIPKFSEPSEDTVIAALRDEKELSVLLFNTIQELPVTWEAAEKDEFIKKTKKPLWLSERQKKGSRVSLFLSASKYYYIQIGW